MLWSFFCTIVVPYLALRKRMTPWSKIERERFSFWEERSVKQLGHSRWCITFFWKSSWQRICQFSDKVYFLPCQQIRWNHGSITNFTKCKIIKSNCQEKLYIITVKPLYSGHQRELKIVSVIDRFPLDRGSSRIGLFCSFTLGL